MKPWNIDEQTTSEVLSTVEGLVGYAESCQEIGQGINSKETVRYRAGMSRLLKDGAPEGWTDAGWFNYLRELAERWHGERR